MKQKIGVHINYWNGTGAERDPQELLSLAACIGADAMDFGTSLALNMTPQERLTYAQSAKAAGIALTLNGGRNDADLSHPDAAGMVLLAAAQKIRTVRERFGRLETPGDMPPDGRGLPQLFAPERQLDERRADRPLPEFQLRAEFEVERVPAARPESAGPQPCFAFAVAAAGEQQFGHAVRHGLLRRVPFIAAGELPVGGAGQRGGSHAEHSQAVPQQAVVDRKIHGFILLVVSG